MNRHAATLILSVVLVSLLSHPILARASEDPFEWLSRMAGAAGRTEYSGTFVFQGGMRGETSRIVHLLENGHEQERLEVLDGSPREIIRRDDEIRCYLPDLRRILVDRRAPGRAFPALLGGDVRALAAHYAIRLAGTDRIAGRAARLVHLDARDAWRYSQRLWADVETGLILKAQMLDERARPVEQFTFTQLVTGSAVDRSEVLPRLEETAAGWPVDNLAEGSSQPGVALWEARRGIVPGFEKTHEMRRRLQGRDDTVVHMVFSDGLVAISAFIAPLGASQPPKPGSEARGAINIHTRMLSGHVLTVLGEVPAATVRRIAEGITERSRP